MLDSTFAQLCKAFKNPVLIAFLVTVMAWWGESFLSLSLLHRCCLEQILAIQVNYYSVPQKVKGKLSICNFFPSALCQKVVTSALLTCDSHYYLRIITHYSIARPKAFHPSCQERQPLSKILFPPFLCYYFS